MNRGEEVWRVSEEVREIIGWKREADVLLLQSRPEANREEYSKKRVLYRVKLAVKEA